MDVEQDHASASPKPDMDADGQKEHPQPCMDESLPSNMPYAEGKSTTILLVLIGNDIQLSHSDRENSNGAPDMMHVEENKIVIDSVDRASGDIWLWRLPKRIHILWITRMYWKPEF